VSIGEIVQHLADLTGLGDRIRWDASKPNGQDYREYDLSKLTATGFKARYSMAAGLKETYDWYRNNAAGARK
jgi:GDP-L-fucose synthase